MQRAAADAARLAPSIEQFAVAVAYGLGVAVAVRS